MSRTSMFVSALLLSVAGSASVAVADATLVPGLTFTARSGPAGTATTDVGAASDVNAVNSISVGEHWDNPCWLRVGKAEINGANTSISDDYDRCTTTGPSETAGWLNNSSIFVNGIQVCTHASNNRLKGVRLFGGVIQANGTFVASGFMQEFERTNCNTWHSLVLCPAGQVATKIRVHHTGDTINALSLGCREVTEL